MKKDKSFMNKWSVRIAIVVCLFLITGCVEGCDTLSPMTLFICQFLPDSGHCYQAAGVQGNDPEQCEKIPVPKQFEKTGSNPPKDKCYLMIAENTGNYELCKKIKGGLYSYEPSECYTDIAVNNVDPKGCKYMTGAAYENCKSKLGEAITVDTITPIDDKMNAIKEQIAEDPTNSKLRQELTAITQQKKDIMDFASGTTSVQYTRQRVNDVIGDVDDEDVKKEITQEYLKYKGQNSGKDIDTLMDKLKQIKEEKEFIKYTDEQANTLVDQLKGAANDYADEKKQELIDGATEKGWEWMKKNGGDNLKSSLVRLEALKEKYDKASEKYKEINDKIEKITKVYNEVAGVYKKIDETNKLLAEGKIQQGQANVIKGAVILGKGLEYATSYVPIFGSTVSAITKGTFDVTINLAKKRAQRSTSLQKCMDDPDNCDPDGITAY